MNIHHLELFYYVARHGGVSAAARKIPYGIQQPAISAQVIQLEDTLGTPLFRRRPFQLTPAGQEIYDYIAPFFEGLDELADKVSGESAQVLRIGAPDTVQRQYLPDLLRAVRSQFPRLQLTLSSLGLDEIEQALLREDVDLAICPLDGRRPSGLKEEVLTKVGLALLLPSKAKIRSAAELWALDRIGEPLISGPADGLVYRTFQKELQRRDVEWYPRFQLSSQEMIQEYVKQGFGIGLIIPEPRMVASQGTRLIPLTDFPKIAYGVVWRGKMTPLQLLFLERAREIASRLTN